MAAKKFYVVWKGKETGVFDNWKDCERQVKGFEGASYLSFTDKSVAERAFRLGEERGRKLKATGTLSESEKSRFGKPVSLSISVDAACSGNPGIMEYRGVDTATGAEIFRQGPFPSATNNIGEFLAIVHALALLKKKNINLPVYSDSATALIWVKNKKAKTKLEPSPKNKKVFDLIERAENWLKVNDYPNQLLKWETEAWGEIPADFGRK